MQFSSFPEGNLTMNFDPAFSSESLRGRNLQTTLILSSAGISLSPITDWFMIASFFSNDFYIILEPKTVRENLQKKVKGTEINTRLTPSR